MLGYVVAYRPEMKVREAELYKAYYCGVCKIHRQKIWTDTENGTEL